MEYRYLVKESSIAPFHLMTAPILGAASGLMHSERGVVAPPVAGAMGGTLGAVPGFLAGSALGRMTSSRVAAPLAILGGTIGALAGGAAGGRITDYLTGLIPGRQDRASSRIATWLKDREHKLGV